MVLNNFKSDELISLSFMLKVDMIVRNSTPEDLGEIFKIYESARKFMLENGNPNQWGSEQPDEPAILTDIAKGHHFVCVDGDRLLGCFALIQGDDPTYKKIIKGKWLDDTPYVVIHRIAVLEHGKGIGSFCMDWCFRRYKNIRIDTHKDNIPMQRLLNKKGFRYCGVIYTQWGDERLAYQKV